MDCIQTELSVLVGRKVERIRKIDGVQKHVSVIDVVMAMTDTNRNRAAEYFRRLSESHPEVKASSFNFKFKGRGQRLTPVTDAKGIVAIIMLLPGRQAAYVRRQAAELLLRYIGGDMGLVQEVCSNRAFQDRFADQQRILDQDKAASSECAGPGKISSNI